VSFIFQNEPFCLAVSFSGGLRLTDYALANRKIRQEVLGSHAPAFTVIITGIFDEKWLLEIEAPTAV
jgi:hypothetical protein